jgi:hypothetical protein
MGFLKDAKNHRRATRRDVSPRPCIGLETEFTLYVDGKKCRPEAVFGNPRHMVREKMIPRPGRSWHLPSGGALYFDTGVIEVATPVMEIGPECTVRAVRSLWEQIAFVRSELDAWEKEKGVSIRLEGFSTHYNVSVSGRALLDSDARQRLALLLLYVLHAPVMLLAANRCSTGIGVRPRDGRIEVTADFTPDPDLMTASAALITGVTLAVAEWAEHDLDQIEARGIPVIGEFAHRRHTSRKGFLARFDCFPSNPFATDPNMAMWETNGGRQLSLRQIAMSVAAKFRRSIRAVSNLPVCRHVFSVLGGRARSLLDFAERPAAYEDVGRTIVWRRQTARSLPRCRYERIIRRVISDRPVVIGSSTYRTERILGWFEIAFRNTRTGQRRVFTLDELADRCAL